MFHGSGSRMKRTILQHRSVPEGAGLFRHGLWLFRKIADVSKCRRRRSFRLSDDSLVSNGPERTNQHSASETGGERRIRTLSWLTSGNHCLPGLQKSPSAVRRSTARWRRSGSRSIQLLERRLLLTVVDFSANRLTVQLTGAESELIVANSGVDTRIRVDGDYVGGSGTTADGRVDSNEIFQIVIVGNKHSNAIDLHNVFRTQTRYLNLKTVNIFGEGGDDYITGSAFNDLVYGGAGNDVISGDTGDDTLLGNDGDDTLNGGVGVDSLVGAQGQDTIYAMKTGPHPDVTDQDLNDIFFAVGLPEYNGPEHADYVFDPDTGQNLRLLTGEYREPLPAGLTVYGDQQDFTWGLANYNGEWSNPVFNITGEYAVIDARVPGQDLLSADTYSLIINVNTGNPEYLFSPALANFRWSLNPETPTRFYDVTGDSVAFLKIGDLENGITKKVRLQDASGESFGVVQSKAGVMRGSLGGRTGEFLAVLESSRQSPTQRTIEAVLVLDLAAAEAEDWENLVVARYSLSGLMEASDDLYSAPDASFLALGDNRSGDPGSLKDRFLMIKLGEMPAIPGTQRLDEPNGTAGLMWSWPMPNVPSALHEASGEEPDAGLLPFKLAHPTFAYGADQQVYFVGGLSLSLVGQTVDLSNGNVIDYQSESSATIGSLIAVNTQSGDFHLLTPGLSADGQYESLVDHVSGTNQVRSTGGYVFASYNTLAHRTWSGDYIRVTLGVAPEEHEITRVTQNRSGARNNTTGESCPECQFFPNSSPDGSRLLLTSTFGVDVSTVDFQASGAPSSTKTFLVDFSQQGSPMVNRMPAIHSGNTFEVPEGTSLITTVVAGDEDLHDFGALEFSLSGVDADHVTIHPATGVLQFKVLPDFDAPADVDQDNVYHVTVTVTDTVGESLTQAISIQVLDAAPRFVETVTGTSLRIDATSGTSDGITLDFQSDGGGDRLVMSVSYDQVYDYSLAAIDHIAIDLGAGDDSLVLRSIVPNNFTLTISGGDDDDYVNTAMSGSRGVSLVGGTGGDTLIAGSGDDTLVGGPGHDFMDGRAGNDSLVGSAGDDTLLGATGNDLLFGHSGNDLIYGNLGDDSLSGNEGDDSLLGGDGDDWLLGHRGDDTLTGGSGADSLFGHSGNDVLNGNSDNDTVEGGSGLDAIVGGSGDDVLSGDSGHDTIAGNSGNDVLWGRSGNDILMGESGSDTLDGGEGLDKLVGGADSDLLVGGGDNDFLDGGFEQDSLATGGGSDTIVDTEDDFIDEAFVNWFQEGFVAP